MRVTQKVTLGALLTLLAAAVVGLYLTSGSAPFTSPSQTKPASEAETPLINQRYLDTALSLASLAATPEEQHAATSALDAADRELDLEYGYALQLSATEPVPQTPEIRAIQDRIVTTKTSIQTRQDEVNRLKSSLEKAKGARRDAIQEQLDVSEAEFNLLQEALADAKEDLIQAGGDPHSRLQELKAEHEAASNAADKFKFPPLRDSAPSGSLLAEWSHWKSIRHTQLEIGQAQHEAFAAAAGMARQHDALEKLVVAEKSRRKTLANHELTPEQIAALTAPSLSAPAPTHKPDAPLSGSAPTSSASQAAANPSPRANSTIALIQRISSDQTRLGILDRRIQALNDLGSAYGNWGLQVAAAAHSSLHSIIAAGLEIILMMVLAFFLNLLIDRFFGRLSLEPKRRTTLQAVIRISVRLVIVVVVLLMIFGKPDQLSTVLGLAGAGLTVVLKDFIVSFLGWFALMGRQGIRVGDWVEINGVRGEVIEISLFRTILLETGNWTDVGQPTGRQVAFLNQYAVDGTYFNFSTSGQWLWDELQVLIPSGQNPYPLVERIRAIVAKETESYTQLAEGEWQRVSSRYGMRSFSAQPTVNVKPTDNGVIAIVRYITRADERTASRYRLNHEIVKLFRNGEEVVAGSEAATAETPASDRH
jgi:small-conductance mechanosensitive channel